MTELIIFRCPPKEKRLILNIKKRIKAINYKPDYLNILEALERYEKEVREEK